MLLFGFAISILTGILFGLAPALQATKPALAPALKSERSTPAQGLMRFGFGKFLVIAQVALSLMLLVGAGLFIRTLENVKAIDAGIRVENVLLASMDPSLNGYTTAQVKNFYQQLLERINALPGVISAGLAQAPLLSGNYSMVGMRGPGRPDPPHGRSILVNDITPKFLETAGIPILTGRDFRREDIPTSPIVAIINEASARYFFGDENPIGKLSESPKTQNIEACGRRLRVQPTSILSSNNGPIAIERCMSAQHATPFKWLPRSVMKSKHWTRICRCSTSRPSQDSAMNR